MFIFSNNGCSRKCLGYEPCLYSIQPFDYFFLNFILRYIHNYIFYIIFSLLLTDFIIPIFQLQQVDKSCTDVSTMK